MEGFCFSQDLFGWFYEANTGSSTGIQGTEVLHWDTALKHQCCLLELSLVLMLWLDRHVYRTHTELCKLLYTWLHRNMTERQKRYSANLQCGVSVHPHFQSKREHHIKRVYLWICCHLVMRLWSLHNLTVCLSLVDSTTSGDGDVGEDGICGCLVHFCLAYGGGCYLHPSGLGVG